MAVVTDLALPNPPCYLSPYGAEHINRFGIYEWNRRHVAPTLDYELEILSAQSFSQQ
jgi:hypothetical protein